MSLKGLTANFDRSFEGVYFAQITTVVLEVVHAIAQINLLGTDQKKFISHRKRLIVLSIVRAIAQLTTDRSGEILQNFKPNRRCVICQKKIFSTIFDDKIFSFLFFCKLKN